MAPCYSAILLVGTLILAVCDKLNLKSDFYFEIPT